MKFKFGKLYFLQKKLQEKNYVDIFIISHVLNVTKFLPPTLETTCTLNNMYIYKNNNIKFVCLYKLTKRRLNH